MNANFKIKKNQFKEVAAIKLNSMQFRCDRNGKNSIDSKYKMQIISIT